MSEIPSSAEANADLIRRYMDEAFNGGDLAKFDAFFAADFVDHDGLPNQKPGPAGAEAAYVQWRHAFPDTHATIDDLIVSGEKVVVRSTLRATQQAAAMGLPATGLPVSIRAISIFRVVDGKIVERWGLVDALGLLRQIGAEPMG